MAQESVSLNKKFGYSKVDWVIKNHCVIAEDETNSIFFSPEFYVRGLHLTKWRMVMRSVIGKDEVFFGLQRLECDPYDGLVLVDCILEYGDGYNEFIEDEFKYAFGVNSMSYKERILMFSGFAPTIRKHIDNFKLNLHILVHFENIKENVPLCQNIGIRKLSENIRQLYEDGLLYDVRIQFGSKPDPTLLHKAILLIRFGNENIKRKIKRESMIDLSDFHYEPAEKVCRFLYSGDMNYPVTEPSVSVYRFAKEFDVKPIVAYYEPDKFSFTSAIKAEFIDTTWTICDFSNRNESFHVSPFMTNNMMDTKWRLKVYPKGIKGNAKDVCVCLNIETKTLKHICVQLFIVGTEIEQRSHSCRLSIISSQMIMIKDFIPFEYVANNYTDLIIGIQLKISIGERSCSIDKSISGDYYFYGRKNYEQFSNDILSIYQNDLYHNMCIDFKDHNIKICLHECILHERCVFLLHVLKHNILYHFTDVCHAVIFELFHFLYSGKLKDILSVEEYFSLYQTARKFSFMSLETVVVEKLQESVSQLNADKILDFAESEGLDTLMNSVEQFVFLHNIGQMII